MNPRTKVVKYLSEITKNKSVTEQLRAQWLAELQADQDRADAERAQRDLEWEAWVDANP